VLIYNKNFYFANKLSKNIKNVPFLNNFF